MSKQDLADLNSMKAKFFLTYEYENCENVAVQLARNALLLEPSNAKWKYCLAKYLRQKRKSVSYTSEIPYEELTLLEEACNMDRKAKYLTYLAQAYRDCGAQTLNRYKNEPNFFNSDLFHQINTMATKALELYKEVLELEEKSIDHVSLRRVGYGIMNLPKKVADYDLALKCLLRSMELFPCQTTEHMLGTYYHRFAKDNEKALECYKNTAKTGSVVGLSDMIRIKYILDPEYNPCEDIESGLEVHVKKKVRSQLLAQLGGYFLFCKRDFLKSLQYFEKAIEEDKMQLLNFKSFFLRMNDPINLLEYLVNEALLFLEKTPSSSKTENGPSSSMGESQLPSSVLIEDFILQIHEIDPKLLEITPDPSLIDQLLNLSEKIKEKEKGYDKSKERWVKNNNQGRDNRGRGFGSSRRDNTYGSIDNPRSCEKSQFGSGRLSVECIHGDFERHNKPSSNFVRQPGPSSNSEVRSSDNSKKQDNQSFHQRAGGRYQQNKWGDKKNEIENWRKK